MSIKDSPKAKNGINIFDAAAILITCTIVGFIAIALLSILLGGIPYLGKALQSDEIRFAMKLSTYTATVSTLCCMLLAIPCGYTLARVKLPFKHILQVIIELPLSLPYLVLGLCLLIVFSSPMGKLLREMGFPVVFNQNGIIMAQLLVNLPFAIRLVRTEIGKMDTRLEFIAATLGASPWQRFRTIIFPQCKISLLMATVLVWSRALGEFGATLMLVGVTRMKTETLPASIYLNISTGDNGMAMASAIILLILSAITLMITSFCNQKLQQQTRSTE